MGKDSNHDLKWGYILPVGFENKDVLLNLSTFDAVCMSAASKHCHAWDDLVNLEKCSWQRGSILF